MVVLFLTGETGKTPNFQGHRVDEQNVAYPYSDMPRSSLLEHSPMHAATSLGRKNSARAERSHTEEKT